MIEFGVELQSYIPGWQVGGFSEQNIEELASYSLETKRIPDPYAYLITDTSEQYSPSGRCLVKSVVNQSTLLGKLEHQAVLATEELVKSKQDGIIVWISPPGHNFYNDTKLIISEIVKEGSRKFLFNRAIILDLNETKALDLAQKLSYFDYRNLVFQSTDQVRSTPLLIEPNGIHWSYILEEFIHDHQWAMVRDGRDKMAKDKALKQALVFLPQLLNGQINEVRQSDFFGLFDGSCPVIRTRKTAFDYIFNESSYWRSGSCRGKDNGGCDATNVEVGPCKLCRQCEQEYNNGQRK